MLGMILLAVVLGYLFRPVLRGGYHHRSLLSLLFWARMFGGRGDRRPPMGGMYHGFHGPRGMDPFGPMHHRRHGFHGPMGHGPRGRF